MPFRIKRQKEKKTELTKSIKEERVVKESIEKLATYVMSDIEKTRQGSYEAEKRVGLEMMALNALCNAERTLNSKCQCKD